MAEIIPYQKKNYRYDKQAIQQYLVALFARLESLYAIVEDELEDKEKLLYKKVESRKQQITSSSWLTLEEGNLLLEKSEWVKDEEQILYFLYHLEYLYLTDIQKKEFLKQEDNYQRELLLFFMDVESSYTSYPNMLSIFLNPFFMEMLSKYVEEKEVPIHHLLISLAESIDFKKDPSLVLENCNTYFIECSKPDLEMERSIRSIYDYYYNQLQALEKLADQNMEQQMEALEKMKVLERLPMDEQEKFIDHVFSVKETYALLDQIRILFNLIEIYAKNLKTGNVVSFSSKWR